MVRSLLTCRLRVSPSDWPVWSAVASDRLFCGPDSSLYLSRLETAKEDKVGAQTTSVVLVEPVLQQSSADTDWTVHRNLARFLHEHSQRELLLWHLGPISNSKQHRLNHFHVLCRSKCLVWLCRCSWFSGHSCCSTLCDRTQKTWRLRSSLTSLEC